MEAIVFMLCLTLHNIEEALWLTDWQSKTMPNNHRTPNKNHFAFAVLGITILGYLSAGLYLLIPNNQYLEFAFIGFVGAMLINAVIPHLVCTIKYKRYCPGVFTGCLLIAPLHLTILCNAVNSHLKVSETVLSTLVVGAALLVLIPCFKWLAYRVLHFLD